MALYKVQFNGPPSLLALTANSPELALAKARESGEPTKLLTDDRKVLWVNGVWKISEAERKG